MTALVVHVVVLVVVAVIAYAIGARETRQPEPVGQLAVDVLDALDAFEAEHGFLPAPEHVQTARALAVARHLTATTPTRLPEETRP